MTDKSIKITRRGLLPLTLGGMLAWAQDKESFVSDLPGLDGPTFTTGVNIVNLVATVRDKQGKPLADLKKEDFLIEEDGKPQEIQYFLKESNQPLTLGFLVDVSGSERTYIPKERNAAYRFIDRVLREDQDQAFIFRFYRNVEMLSYLSSSRAGLETALAKLEDPPKAEKGNFQYQMNGMFFGTALFNAVYIASDSIMRKQAGRKAIIIMSDGEDTGSTSSVTAAIEAAQRADTIIYTLGFYDEASLQVTGGGGRLGQKGAGGGGSNGSTQRPGQPVMRRMAQETGGRYFDTLASVSVDQIFDSIQEELRHQYTFAYTPTDPQPGYKKIRISVKGNKNATVQAREGYYSGNSIADKRKMDSKAKF